MPTGLAALLLSLVDCMVAFADIGEKLLYTMQRNSVRRYQFNSYIYLLSKDNENCEPYHYLSVANTDSE